MTLYVFDLDKTLLKVNISFKYYQYLFRKKIFSLRTFFKAFHLLLCYIFFKLSPKKLHEAVYLSFLKDKSISQIFYHVDDFLDLYLNKYINPKIFSILQNIQQQKGSKKIYLLSNSPEILIEKICTRLNISAGKGSTYLLDKNNCIIGLKDVMDGDSKATFCRNLKKKDEKLVVFTDSIWDRPLLELATKSYIVNPDRKLKSLAVEKGWEII